MQGGATNQHSHSFAAPSCYSRIYFLVISLGPSTSCSEGDSKETGIGVLDLASDNLAMSDFSRSLGELRETNQVVEDTVEYCESLLSQFSQQEGVDTNVVDEAKECVRNAIEHVVEHIHATGEQLDLALKVEESKTETALNKVQELSERVSKLDS